MRDPSLVASKADIRQQAISGGELPGTEVADPYAANSSRLAPG